MTKKKTGPALGLEVPTAHLRWKLDARTLPFSTTEDLELRKEIIGQKRGVEAFRFGMGICKKGYNIIVTGQAGSGRLATVKKLLTELSQEDKVPDDLCYVNNFKNNEEPVLLRFPAGTGEKFRKAVQDFLENVKRDVPQVFESKEYVARKKEIMEAHEKKTREFYLGLEEKVKDSGLVLVNMQIGPVQRPDVVPLVDGEPVTMVQLEEKVEKGRFPREEFEAIKRRQQELKDEVERIISAVRELQKEVKKKSEDVDRLMFVNMARDLAKPLMESFGDGKVRKHVEGMIEDMADNLDTIRLLGQPPQPGPIPGMPFMAPPAEAILHPYQVSLLVDNSELTGPPVIIESFPNYRNLFGSIERVMDRGGVWRTDFTKVKAGSFVRANGGYLVLNLVDAIMEPGVWQTLKRALRTSEIEIQTFDPYYFLTATGLKPEPIRMEVKVVVLADARLYHLLLHYDEDAPKIFKVRADFEISMDRTDDTILQVARFVKALAQEEELLPFDREAVAGVVEEAVRMSGRQEKLSTAFPILADILTEADHFARREGAAAVSGGHVEAALEARIYRSNQVEERIQEMIDRGSLFIDTAGAVVGQVNGLAVYSLGDYMFGKPSRITAVTSLGKEGIINIEREADLSGAIHNKGMLILAGYLRRRFAQDKPLSLAASIAFEQSYGGVDGDSASSTELYALLSSLSGVPLRQDIAVTGSVNQKGEVQPIGGVNAKIEGFYLCCKRAGLNGRQGVMIPEANVKDLMLRKEVVEAVEKGEFHVWSVRTIDQGIELLTGTPAGEQDAKGRYPEGSINRKVDDRLRELGKLLRKFGEAEKKSSREEKPSRKKPRQARNVP